jgi:hypothetical protein
VRGLHRRRPCSSFGLQGRAPRSWRQPAGGKLLTHPTEDRIPDSRGRAREAQASCAVRPVRGLVAPEGVGGLNPRRARSTNRTWSHAQFFLCARSFELFFFNSENSNVAGRAEGGEIVSTIAAAGRFVRAQKNRTKWRKLAARPGVLLGRGDSISASFFERSRPSKDSGAQSADYFFRTSARAVLENVAKFRVGGSVAGLLQGT